MKGKVVLMTGATDGIGKAAALELAKMGAQIALVGRNPQKTERVAAMLRQRSGNPEIWALNADLASLAQVRQLAAGFRARYARLDVLAHNAAVYTNQRTETEDGYEMQFAVDHLAGFLLTYLLLDMLKASAPARVVVTSSQVHVRDELDFADLQMKHGYNPRAAYNRAKLANVLFTLALARRLTGSGVTANCLHPGVVSTNLLHNYQGGVGAGADNIEGLVSHGYETLVHLISAPEVDGVSGKYFVERKISQPAAISDDKEVQERLWQISNELVGIGEDW